VPTNILNLPCYKVLGIQENEHDYHIDVEAAEPPTSCPHCQSSNLVGFGRREQTAKDLPMHGRRVGLYLDTRRYRCRNCGKTFYESLPGIDEKRFMTKRLAQWMGKQAIKRTFAGIAEEVGCTEFTVRAVFNDYVNALEKTIRFETPKWMGLGEIHIIKPRGVIANIQHNTIVNLLPNRDKKTVINHLGNLDGRHAVQTVAMDMWTPYRDAVRAVMPDARIVIDKFHVVRMANDAVEKVRKSLRESLTPKQRRGLMHDRFVLLKRERDLNDRERLLLSGWTANYPDLGEAYRLKEAFYGVYEGMGTPDQALDRYAAWHRSVTPEARDAYSDLIRAFTNWQPQILAYFEHPVTNAYTESLNSLIRVMNRLGRGYSFEALRAKILFTEGVHNKIKPKFRRREVMADDMAERMDMFSTFQHAAPEMERNFGADISTLARLIEEGKL